MNRVKGESVQKISSVEQKIEEIGKEKDELQETKLREISLMIAQIEAKYKREHERLHGERELLNASKETELKAIERSASKITQKQKALGHWLGLVEFYADPENND